MLWRKDTCYPKPLVGYSADNKIMLKGITAVYSAFMDDCPRDISLCKVLSCAQGFYACLFQYLVMSTLLVCLLRLAFASAAPLLVLALGGA